MTKGIDCASHITTATAKKLKAAGYDFACRYFGYGWKITDKAECQIISDAGLRVLCVWEHDVGDYKGGAVRGAKYGEEARKQAISCGMPYDAIIYAAIDTEVTDYSLCAAYLMAFAAAIAPYRLGVYGGYGTIDEMAKRGIGAAYWQTIAWSYGKISQNMNVYQYNTSHAECGIYVDNDRCEDMDAAGMWQLPEEVKGMLYDISGCTAKYIKPGTILANWIKKQTAKPYALINASLYESASVPVGTIIEGRKLVHNAGNGLGVGTVHGVLMYGAPWDIAWDDYLTGYNCPVQNGKYVAPTFSDSYVFPCKLNRIGLGRKAGKWFIVTADGVTLQGFAEYAISQGCDTLVNLDGGGSRYLYYGGKTVYVSTRTPYNALAFYKPGTEPKPDTCPYKEPTTNIRRGSIGEGAKWVQWQLNRRGYSLTVDGIIGSKSAAALQDFQKKNGLAADGICGVNTRRALNG